MPTKALRNKRIKTKMYLMDVPYDLDGNRKCKGSNWVRAGFEPYQSPVKEIFPLIQYLIQVEVVRTRFETFECNGVILIYWFPLCPRLDS